MCWENDGLKDAALDGFLANEPLRQRIAARYGKCNRGKADTDNHEIQRNEDTDELLHCL